MVDKIEWDNVGIYPVYHSIEIISFVLILGNI